MVTIKDIYEARRHIQPYIYQTPCAYSERLSTMTHCSVYLKMENLQMTASYKERGAMNRMLHLTEDEKKNGVIAASAGNHAQGVAYAAKRLGIHATIVMPETTPLSKIRGTQEHGADIILFGSGYDDAYQRALEVQAERHCTFIHAFDDPFVVMGQGTVALELMEQCPDVDVVICPIGGGGLIAGMSIVLKTINPAIRIVGVESVLVPSMQKSIEAGKVVRVPSANTLADGIAVAKVGQCPFEIIQQNVDEIVSVNEEEIANAIMMLLEYEKTLVEGSGATGFAALYNNKIADIEGKKVAIILTGGNIDITVLSKILDRGLAKDGRLANFKVIVPDKPGSIATIATIVAESRANILQINHHRVFAHVNLRETEIEFTVETRGMEHSNEIIKAIASRGYKVERS
jgi:threonine dehydratase